jgi:hypothetical protein
MSHSVSGQVAQVDTINLEPSNEFKDLDRGKLTYPIIRTGDPNIDSLINSDLQIRLTSNQSRIESLDSALLSWTNDGISDLDFQVTYNNNGILSINVGVEWCNAYCDFWTGYFNYSTTSGKWLSLDDVADITGVFGTIIQEDRKKLYRFNIDNLKKLLQEGELGADEFTEIKQRFVECEREQKAVSFSIFPERIIIVETCWLHHSQKPLVPTVNLSYEFTSIENYLKIEGLLNPN